jgi:SAM-dependent MidA family methyltransferase
LHSPAAHLPEPDRDAREHSLRVARMLEGEIAEGGGFLPLARFIDRALYAPGLGYYVAGARKFGGAGDFVTAPELTPLFGETLAVDVEAILAASRGREVVEWGAGSGSLAQDLLAALDRRGARVSRYVIVETSATLRQRQRERLAHDARVVWLDAPPASISGAVLMNEVLDAIAPVAVARRGGAWRERGVALHDGRFVLAERALDDAATIAIAAARFPPSIDYASEINPAAEALVEGVGASLADGALLIVDYGFAAHEYYHPQRAQGTLMAHYRHRASADLFIWPGLTDLTAHVDFSAIAAAGVRGGLTVAGFAPQAAYLLGAGILDRLLDTGEPGSVEFVRASTALQALTSPVEMGELFKVLALARSPGIRWRGFAMAERSHTL